MYPAWWLTLVTVAKEWQFQGHDQVVLLKASDPAGLSAPADSNMHIIPEGVLSMEETLMGKILTIHSTLISVTHA